MPPGSQKTRAEKAQISMARKMGRRHSIVLARRLYTNAAQLSRLEIHNYRQQPQGLEKELERVLNSQINVYASDPTSEDM
jgi:hypothetical protein